jgi:rod shape-determining protein MreD
MRFFWYIGVSLVLVVFRTTLLTYMPATGNFFDPLLALVVYLAVYRPLPESISLLVFVGILMDTVSGGPFGLYLSSYVWLFIGVRLAGAYIRLDAPVPLVLSMAAGVLLQNLVFLAVMTAFHLTRVDPGTMLGMLIGQLGWVLLVGPLPAVLMRAVEGSSAESRRRPAVSEQ